MYELKNKVHKSCQEANDEIEIDSDRCKLIFN